MKKNQLFKLAAIILANLLYSTLAKADDWGCQVLLCLSNPAGAEAVAECVPPIERLWAALSKMPPDPFPTCEQAAASGNYAVHNWADGNFCPPTLTVSTGSDTPPICLARGAVTANFNGKPFTRVWWGIDGPKNTLQEWLR
jgi:hypothetical protein